MKLSILIPTITERSEQFKQLLATINHQIAGESVELLWDLDNREKSIGQKRNELVEKASGEYICFVDDDDKVSPKYVSRILEGLESGSDVITFLVQYKSRRDSFLVYYSKDFEKDAIPIYTDSNGRRFTNRLPNHLMPVKRELALKAKFPEIYFREDAIYAERLKPLIKTQFEIPLILYHYLYTK